MATKVSRRFNEVWNRGLKYKMYFGLSFDGEIAVIHFYIRDEQGVEKSMIKECFWDEGLFRRQRRNYTNMVEGLGQHHLKFLIEYERKYGAETDTLKEWMGEALYRELVMWDRE